MVHRLKTTPARAALTTVLAVVTLFAATPASAQDEPTVGPTVVKAGAVSWTLPPLPPGEPPRKAGRAARRLNARGLDAHRKGDWNLAITHYVAALESDPAHVLARYNLACALARRGDRDMALAVLAELRRPDCARCKRQLEHAQRDTDFQTLHADPRFLATVEISKPTVPPSGRSTPASVQNPALTDDPNGPSDAGAGPALGDGPVVSAGPTSSTPSSAGGGARKGPEWGVAKGLGRPDDLVGPAGPKVAPMIRFRRWKRALPDFCTRRDMQVMETAPEDGAWWVFAWSFEGTGDDLACSHPTVGLVASPRGAVETTAYCVDGIDVLDIDGDGRKDLLINHVGCNGPLEGEELEICLDRPVAPWCKTVAVEVVSYEIVKDGKRDLLQVTVASDLATYSMEDDDAQLTWRHISWDGAQLTETAYKVEPDNDPLPE